MGIKLDTRPKMRDWILDRRVAFGLKGVFGPFLASAAAGGFAGTALRSAPAAVAAPFSGIPAAAPPSRRTISAWFKNGLFRISGSNDYPATPRGVNGLTHAYPV